LKSDQARRPLISVIIPTFNSADFIEESVHSVSMQTYPEIELIIVDDGSTDATIELLDRMPGNFNCIRQENKGTGAARNTGVLNSSGDYLAFLDADDIWLENKLELQMDVFDLVPDTDVVYGHTEQFCSPELPQNERARLLHLTGQRLPAPLAPAMLIRRRAFEQVGPFDTSLRIGVEMEWYGRLRDEPLNVTMLDELVYRRRLHRSNTNRLYYNEQAERLLVLKRMLNRRRSRAAPNNR